MFNERRDWAGDKKTCVVVVDEHKSKKIASEKKTVLKIRVNKLCWKNEVINQQKEVKKWMSETVYKQTRKFSNRCKKKNTRE